MFSKANNNDYKKNKVSDKIYKLFEKRREERALKQAEIDGDFYSPTKYDISNAFSETHSDDSSKISLLNDNIEPDLSEVYLVKLSHWRIRNLADVCYCFNLVVLDLSDNYVSSIQPLAACCQLYKLDLNSNKISALPNQHFWSGFPNLNFLYLHNNPLGRITDIANLSYTSNLQVLTMHGTPFSLHKNYRHHVVNTIGSLRTLDDYIIADDEIIEDAHFSGSFSRYHPELHLPAILHSTDPTTRPRVYNPDLTKNATFYEHMYSCRRLLNHVNWVLSHHSPVIVLQRYIRGHLVRKLLDPAVFSKFWKNLKRPKTSLALSVPNATSQSVRAISHASTAPPPSSPATATRGDTGRRRLDYDTYMRQHIRPGSTQRDQPNSVGGSSTHRFTPDIFINIIQDKSSGAETSPVTDHSSRLYLSPKPRRSFHVNVDKLQASVLKTLSDEKDKQNTQLKPVAISDFNFASTNDTNAVDHDGATKDQTHDTEAENKEDVCSFRLTGQRSDMKVYDRTMGMMLGRRETGRDIRHAIMEQEKSLADQSLTVSQAVKERVYGDRAMLERSRARSRSRANGCISGEGCRLELLSLQAVQQAYDKRSIAENIEEKNFNVQRLRQQRLAGKNQSEYFLINKRNEAKSRQESDKAKEKEMLNIREQYRHQTLHQNTDIRQASLIKSIKNKEERKFVQEFGAQNICVSKALCRHDRSTKKVNAVQNRCQAVYCQKEIQNAHRRIVKRYLNHRCLVRQSQAAQCRALLDAQILLDTKHRAVSAMERANNVRHSLAAIHSTVNMLPSITNVN